MTNKRVLIVDDEPGIREIIQLSLEAMTDWEVLTAASGEEGIAIAQQQCPDAILLDMMMPKMDGIETLKRLKANPAIKSIPVILVTAKTLNQEKPELAQLAIAGIIAKPFKALELMSQLQLLLNWEN